MQAVLQFWLSAGKALSDTMSKEEYFFIHRRIAQALAPTLTEAEAEVAASDDWREDLNGAETMNFERYALGLCGIADMWTDSVDELDYVVFLNKLYRRITCVRGRPTASDTWKRAEAEVTRRRRSTWHTGDRSGGDALFSHLKMPPRRSESDTSCADERDSMQGPRRQLSRAILSLLPASKQGHGQASSRPTPMTSAQTGAALAPVSASRSAEGGSEAGQVTFRVFRAVHEINDLTAPDRPHSSQQSRATLTRSSPAAVEGSAAARSARPGGRLRQRLRLPVRARQLGSVECSSAPLGEAVEVHARQASVHSMVLDAQCANAPMRNVSIGAGAQPLPPIAPHDVQTSMTSRWDLALNVTMAAIRLTTKMKRNRSAKASAAPAGEPAASPWAEARPTPLEDYSFSNSSTSGKTTSSRARWLSSEARRAGLARQGSSGTSQGSKGSSSKGNTPFRERLRWRRSVEKGANQAAQQDTLSPHPPLPSPSSSRDPAPRPVLRRSLSSGSRKGSPSSSRNPAPRPVLRRGFSSGSRKGLADHWLAPPRLERQGSSNHSGSGGLELQQRTLNLEMVGRCYELFLEETTASTLKQNSEGGPGAAVRSRRGSRKPRQEGEVHSDDGY